MSRKNRRREGGQTAEAGSRAEVERLLDKGRLRDAFKQAKLCFRQQNSEENRRLLERIYLLRIKDLSQSGMPAAAVEVAGHFIEFGVTEPAALREFVALLPKLGMLDEARRFASQTQMPEAQASLSLAMADQAVLHPDQTPASLSDVRAGAERIRLSLAALDQQAEGPAMELLKDIPRGSPWADWRYFVRGLAAFRGGDAERAFANWDRLDATRPAARIAATLRAASIEGSSNGARRDRSDTNLSRLEMAVFGESVLTRLDRVRRLIDKANPKRDWQQALAQLPFLRLTLRRIDSRLAQRLTEIMIPSLIDEATGMSRRQATYLLNDFTRVAEPPPLDPHWNRLWALYGQQAGDIEVVAKHWQKYVEDIESAADLEADQRRQIQALVWWHLGGFYADEARDAAPPLPGIAPSDEVPELRELAVRALQESLLIEPARRGTHESLMSLYEQWDEPDNAAATARQLLEAFPNDLAAAQLLGEYHFQRDEHDQAIGYIQRARRLKPLDPLLVDLEHWSHIGLARHHALAHRWDEGRAAFAAAESLRPADATDETVLARRAIFELKAGQAKQSEELIERAKAVLAEPAPLWLALAIEAARYRLSAARIAEFNRELKAALRKRKTSGTAGKLAQRLYSYKTAEIEYSGSQQHLRDVLDYLRSTTRTKYAEDDLVQVCHLLHECPEESKLFGQLLNRGLRNFPRCPVFQFYRARQDLDRGPFACDFGATRKRLEKALALAEADPQGRYAALVPEVKRQLSLIGSLCEAASRMEDEFGHPGFFGRMPGFIEMLNSMANFESHDDDDDEDEDDSGYFDDSFDFFRRPFAEPSRPRRGTKGKRRGTR